MYHRLLLSLAPLGLAGCDWASLPTLVDPEPIPWEVLERPLGRGHVLARNSLRDAGALVLRLEPLAANGGQFRTRERFEFGIFEADIRCPRAPGSLCAFFLYEDLPGDRDDEIDIEIFNDGSRRALLVTWIAGVQTNKREITLPFDPAAAHHTYRIDRRYDRITFSVDGVEYAEFITDLPRRPMHVYVNAWYPTWLEPDSAAAPLMHVRDFRFTR